MIGPQLVVLMGVYEPLGDAACWRKLSLGGGLRGLPVLSLPVWMKGSGFLPSLPLGTLSLES